MLAVNWQLASWRTVFCDFVASAAAYFCDETVRDQYTTTAQCSSEMPDRRPGTEAASAMLQEESLSKWKAVLQQYDDAVERVARHKKTSELINLDAWLWKEYPLLVKSRTPFHCQKDELRRVMKWKLLRGKNRPALLNLINQNSEDSVKEISSSAFCIILKKPSDWKDAMVKLTSLRGVGPATASAILAPLCSSLPFMADEVLEAVTASKRQYNFSAYESMHVKMDQLSERLHNQLTLEQIGKVLWTASMLFVHSPPETEDIECCSSKRKLAMVSTNNSSNKSLILEEDESLDESDCENCAGGTTKTHRKK